MAVLQPGHNSAVHHYQYADLPLMSAAFFHAYLYRLQVAHPIPTYP